MRRLKCNRGHPCDNCTKRGDIPSCSYAAPSSRKKVAGAAGPLATPDDMQNRIDRLENLVLSLMTNGSSQQNGASAATAQAAINSARSSSIGAISKSHSIDADGEDMIREDDPEDSDVNDVSQRIGVMKVDGGKAVLISDAHWYTILADVRIACVCALSGLADADIDRRSQELFRESPAAISRADEKGHGIQRRCRPGRIIHLQSPSTQRQI